MAIKINRFRKESAALAHENTILASKVLPEGMDAPFDHAFGYLEKEGEMEYHSHPALECYVVLEGSGYVIINGEEAAVTAGDIIEIPRNSMHTMKNVNGKPFLWFALWWK